VECRVDRDFGAQLRIGFGVHHRAIGMPVCRLELRADRRPHKNSQVSDTVDGAEIEVSWRRYA
jgi:hypothetical protein